MTYLCVPIFVEEFQRAKRDIALAAETGADMIELRIDSFPDPAAIRDLIDDAGLPCIVTCRAKWEGGLCELDDDQRVFLLDDVNVDAAYTDIELAAGKEAIARFAIPADVPASIPQSRLIVSAHDFSG